MVSLKDNRLKESDRVTKPKKDDPAVKKVSEKPQQSSALFFSYNTQLGPPYHIILGEINESFLDVVIRFVPFQIQISSTSVSRISSTSSKVSWIAFTPNAFLTSQSKMCKQSSSLSQTKSHPILGAFAVSWKRWGRSTSWH